MCLTIVVSGDCPLDLDKGRGLGTGHFLLGFDRELTRVYNLADVPPAPRSEAWRQQELEF